LTIVAPRDFYQVRQEIEQTVSKLKETRESQSRRELLAELRRLLAEADQITSEMPG
jgi:hypothetical protein